MNIFNPQYFEDKYFDFGLDSQDFPDNVKTAIQNNLVTPKADIETGIAELMEAYEDPDNYSGLVIDKDYQVDAYTVFYLPRYFNLPVIAMRCLSKNPNSFNFGDAINILDLGSGTGAATLGFYDIFSDTAFDSCQINYHAADWSQISLDRQEALINAVRKRNFIWTPIPADLNDQATRAEIFGRAEWDIIFSANFLIELEIKKAQDIITESLQHIKGGGHIIICEPQYNRLKPLMQILCNSMPSLGATVYYPCKIQGSCQKDICWMWNSRNITRVTFNHKGEFISSFGRKLNMYMYIINKTGNTIFDAFSAEYPIDDVTTGQSYGRKHIIDLCGIGEPGINDRINRGSICYLDRDNNAIKELFRV